MLPDGTLLLAALEPACTMIAAQDSQASFRLAQSRLQLGIDQRPHHQGVWRFSQCLLAEAETLSLMINAPIASPQPSIKVKQMDAPAKPSVVSNGQTDKGKGVSTVAQPCRYFRSDTGCKAGKNCKWSHSWDGVEDKNARCWICGGKDHRKSDCKVKGSQSKGSNKDSKPVGEPGAGSGGGKGQTALNAGAPKSTGAGAPSSATTYATPKLQEMDAGEQTPAPPQGEAGGGGAAKQGGGGETGATSSEVLLQEATKLLKSLRAPQLRVIKMSQLDYDNSSMMVLLDSGATHALRPATGMEEWESANPTQVSLADGVTDKLRLKPNSKVLLSSPQEEEAKQSWIVPMGGITELGYKFGWKGARCWLCDEQGKEVAVTINQNCPMVSKEVGRELINKLEIRQLKVAMKTMLVNALLTDQTSHGSGRYEE